MIFFFIYIVRKKFINYRNIRVRMVNSDLEIRGKKLYMND